MILFIMICLSEIIELNLDLCRYVHHGFLVFLKFYPQKNGYCPVLKLL